LNTRSAPLSDPADPVDYHDMLQRLRDDLSNVNRAIAALERYGTGAGKRRGRPPKWLSASAAQGGTEND
jgi:hypothetical protein